MKKLSYQRIIEYLNLGLFIATSLVLVGFENREVGIFLLLGGILTSLACSDNFRKNFGLIYFCLLVLGYMPISTTIDLPQALYMGLGLATVVIVPYLITKYVYKTNTIRFPSLKEKAWRKNRIFYLLFTAAIGYFIVPLMLKSTGSYLNWNIEPGFWNLLESYIGLNIVGIWDELFFVCTILAILQKHFPFLIANLAQAVLFTAFLYALAFEGWCVIVIYIFAIIQGYIFKKTKSLLYILAIHLTVDLVIHLSLVYLHLPYLFPYFIA